MALSSTPGREQQRRQLAKQPREQPMEKMTEKPRELQTRSHSTSWTPSIQQWGRLLLWPMITRVLLRLLNKCTTLTLTLKEQGNIAHVHYEVL